MLEHPEAVILARQINETLIGKQIKFVEVNQTPHKLAWFVDEAKGYESLLFHQTIRHACAYGGLLEITLDDCQIVIGDGTRVIYSSSFLNELNKHQLFLQFQDDSTLAFSIQMYGGIWAFKTDTFDNPYYLLAKTQVQLSSEAFDFPYFQAKLTTEKPTLSLKAFLATEQRFVGLGNGVLQSILWNARLHPKTKIQTLTEIEQKRLFDGMKDTVQAIIEQGPRDTETDLFGVKGHYPTLPTFYANQEMCPHCKTSHFIKEAYMGGSIYTCPTCQPFCQ